MYTPRTSACLQIRRLFFRVSVFSVESVNTMKQCHLTTSLLSSFLQTMFDTECKSQSPCFIAVFLGLVYLLGGLILLGWFWLVGFFGWLVGWFVVFCLFACFSVGWFVRLFVCLCLNWHCLLLFNLISCTPKNIRVFLSERFAIQSGLLTATGRSVGQGPTTSLCCSIL